MSSTGGTSVVPRSHGEKRLADAKSREEEETEMKKRKRTLELAHLPKDLVNTDSTQGLEEKGVQANLPDPVGCTRCQDLEKVDGEKDMKIKELEEKLKSTLIAEVDEEDEEGDAPLGEESVNKDKPIFMAILEGQSKAEVQSLVESGEEWDVPNADGDTVLHLAAKAGRPELVKYFLLLFDEPDVNARNSSGSTPLMEAVKSGKDFLDVFDVLVKNKADLEAKDLNGNTLLDIAIAAGRSAKVFKKIIKSTPNWNFQNSRTSGGNTVLHVAAKNGNLKVLKYILSRGPDANARNIMGETPVMTATFAKQNFLPMVDLLLKNGANINFHNKSGHNVVHYAVKNRRSPEELQHLMTAGATWNIGRTDGKTILHTCAEYGNVEALRYFIGKRVDVKAVDDNGVTPVMEAAECGMCKAMNFLIENGAEFEASELLDLAVSGNGNITVEGNEGLLETIKSLSERGAILDDIRRVKVFHTFVEYGNLEGVRYLIMNGADVNGRDSNGDTPLIKAIVGQRRPQLEIFDLLMENRGDIHAADQNGFNVLHRACSMRGFQNVRGRSLEVLQKLIHHGATWRNTVTGEDSILHAAVNGGRPDVVEYFVARGVDANAKNWWGDTPLLHAARESMNLRQFGEIMRILVNGGADPNAVDDEGNTALLIITKVMLSGVIRLSRSFRCLELPQLKLLVALGCDSRIPNKAGETILSVLRDHGKFHLLKHFKSPL